MSVTKIEWTDRTWNPLTGCTKVSPGCDHCYAKTMHERFHGKDTFDTIELHPERLNQPLRWRKPARVFVNSMSDLFHKDVPDDYIARVFAVMASSAAHTFQVLTKRHARMRSLLSSPVFREDIAHHWTNLLCTGPSRVQNDFTGNWWPLPNVWLGVSVETQKWADIRIPALLDTPAAVRFLSCEPLLGPIDLGIGDPHRGHDSDDVNGHPHPRICLTCSTADEDAEYFRRDYSNGVGIDWVIAGGESGPGARPMHPGWVRSLRDQCVAAAVPFLFKQWGEWRPTRASDPLNRTKVVRLEHNGETRTVRRLGKKNAGRELDGHTWDQYPAVIA